MSEIEERLERVWVAHCSRCNDATLIYRDRVDEAARELVNNGWGWYERSKRLICHRCMAEWPPEAAARRIASAARNIHQRSKRRTCDERTS